MPVFFLAEIVTILDQDLYREYIEKVSPVIKRFGGEYIVRSSQLTPISGEWDASRIVLIRFTSKAQLHECFQSAEYQAIAQLREASTVSKAIIIDE